MKMERELEEVYAEKQRDLVDYLDKHNIKVLYALNVIEPNSLMGKTKYLFVNEEDRDALAEKIEKDKFEKYEVTNFDNLYYSNVVPSLCGSNGVEFGSIASLLKFKQELKYIIIPVENVE